MKNINTWHPLPRYGLAAAMVQFDLDDCDIERSTDTELLDLAAGTLFQNLSDILMKAESLPEKEQAFKFRPVADEELEPGKKSGQVAEHGFFIMPHVTTSNNAADVVKEIRNLLELIGSRKHTKPYELKRSFSPVIAKFNAGKKSMSNPKVSLLEAALTAVATVTSLKPAAFNYDDALNVSLIPDLPFYDEATNSFPLLMFIRLFRLIQKEGLGVEAYIGSFDSEKKRFRRPSIYYGNYPNPPRSYGFGSVSVLAAMGKWLNEFEIMAREIGDELPVLGELAGRSVYVLSYGGTSQESFGHHLVQIAQSGYLYEVTSNAWRVSFPNVEDRTKFSDPAWKNFIRVLDQFLRFFNSPAWSNFLAQRAYYPSEFAQLFKTFFMEKKNIPETVVHSAMQYGKSLNVAAYLTAKRQREEDEQAGRRTGPTLDEYKNRTLTQFESTIRSAKSATALLAQMATIVGRLTMRDIHPEGALFMQEVAKGNIDQETARDLIIAFMRLGTYTKKNVDGELKEPITAEE